MNKLVKIGSRALLGAMVCGCSYFAPAAAADDMAAFREALTKPVVQDTRIMRENISFFVPSGQARLDVMAQLQKDGWCMAGGFDVLFHDADGGSLTEKIPFFIEQDKKNMTIYYKMGKKWEKFEAPSLATVLTNAIATPNSKEIAETIAMVKDVKVVRESNSERTMFVKLDSDKVADAVAAYNQANPADKGTADDAEFQKNVMKYLDKGIRRAEISYMWTVDKNTWQTVTESTNLTGVVQETAKAVLEDNVVQGNPLLEEILQTVAYYSDLKEYTVFLTPKAKAKLMVPKEVKEKAVLSKDIIGNKAVDKKTKK